MNGNALKALSRDNSGAAAVEFALVSSAFISFVLGIFYLTLMLFTNLSLNWAVQRAIRAASINPAVSQSSLASEVNGYLTAMGLPAANVSYVVTGGSVPTAHISATLAQSYTVPLISTFNITFAADAYVAQGS
jgi:Flp pilus assembly protein TadG